MLRLSEHNRVAHEDSLWADPAKSEAGVLCDSCGTQMRYLEMGDIPISESWCKDDGLVICPLCGQQGIKVTRETDRKEE